VHVDTGVYESHSKYEEQKRLKGIFDSVISAYRDVISLSPLVACNYDPDVRSRRLGPEMILYKIDIQISTAKALKNNPELIRQWENAVFDEDVNVGPSIVRQCARVYQLRKLQPHIYMKKMRKGRPDRRTKLPVEVAA
jgi:hypothetical protein